MTYEEKVAWLRRYQQSLRRECELAAELEQLHSRACKVTPALTGMPSGPGDGQSLLRAVESIVQAQQELKAQINVCGAIRREIVAALEQVTNARDYEILRRCGAHRYDPRAAAQRAVRLIPSMPQCKTLRPCPPSAGGGGKGGLTHWI